MANTDPWGGAGSSSATQQEQKSSLTGQLLEFIDQGITSLQNRNSLEYKARGDGREFDKKNYEVFDHSYPDDLMSENNQYGDNYVIFYINVSTDSKMFKGRTENQIESLTVGDVDPRDRGDLIAQEYNKTQVIGTQAAVSAGLGGLVSGGSPSVSVPAGVFGGAAAWGVSTQTSGFTRPQKRLKTAIALHVPNTLNINYGVQWAEDSTFAFQATAEVLRIAGDTARSLIDAAGSVKGVTDISGMKDAASKGIKGVVDAVKSGAPALTAMGMQATSPALGAASGLATNPKMEQIFKGVDYRTFNFDYQFYPRNSKEAANVRRIIESFKYHMHPEFKDDGNWLYIYPSEFDIYYYHGTKENRNIHRHTSCVLTAINVNYTPQGQFTTFEDGMPTQINVTMTFKELALLTKDKIKDGM